MVSSKGVVLIGRSFNQNKWLGIDYINFLTKLDMLWQCLSERYVMFQTGIYLRHLQRNPFAHQGHHTHYAEQ